MTNLRNLVVLLSLFLLGACGSEAGAAGNVTGTADSVTKLLSGITDSKTAEAAKTELTSLTETLSGALGSLKSTAESTTETTGADVKDKLGALAKKAASAISPEMTKSFSGITEQVARLMGNPEIAKVIGPTLEKLKGLIAQ